MSKRGSAHRWADFFDTGIQNLFPHMASASILAVPMMTSSLSMYVFFVHNKICFLIACYLKISLEVTFQIALVSTITV
jgi:hypothetical protein